MWVGCGIRQARAGDGNMGCHAGQLPIQKHIFRAEPWAVLQSLIRCLPPMAYMWTVPWCCKALRAAERHAALPKASMRMFGGAFGHTWTTSV